MLANALIGVGVKDGSHTRLLLIGIVALLLGATLSSVVYQRLQARMSPPKVGVDVVVAANDIQVGAKIGDLDLKIGN